MTIGGGIAVVGIWLAVAVAAVYAGPVAVGVAFFAMIPTCTIALVHDK